MACPGATACATSMDVPRDAFALTVILGIPLGAWVGRSLWLLEAGRRAANRLEFARAPAVLLQALRRTAVSRVRYLATAEPTAFCAGALRPSIYVSRGLVRALRPDELDAVLLHEAHHRHRLDPLRRATAQSLSDIVFFAPVLHWWAERQIERSELAADRAALGRLGPRAVAGALWVAGQPATTPAGVGFAGTGELRVAQLLGDQPPPSLSTALGSLTSSTVGLAMAVALVSCLLHVAALLG